METKAIVATIGAGLIGGYVGTKMMESVSMKLYEWESEDDRQQEDTVRPGPPFRIAAEKTIGLLGVEPSEEQLHKVSMLFHYGAGLSWGPVYTFLRHRPGLPPVWAALLTGTSMSAILDEGLTLMLLLTTASGLWWVRGGALEWRDGCTHVWRSSRSYY